MKVPYIKKGKKLVRLDVQGVLERVYGVAYASGLDDDGEPEYEGETDIDWDSQKSVIRCVSNWAQASRVWVDTDGNEHLEDDLIWKDETA